MKRKLLTIAGGFVFIMLWCALVQFALKYFTVDGLFAVRYTPIGLFFFRCIFAPLWEELAFRHAPLQIARKMGKAHNKSFVIPVVILSSAIFGWCHDNPPTTVLIQGVCGLAFSYVYIKNGYHYWSSVATHFLWNFSLTFIFPLL